MGKNPEEVKFKLNNNHELGNGKFDILGANKELSQPWLCIPESPIYGSRNKTST